ncbi:uncharacterized protein CLUP02_00994 [Colletotrichum lupini]|uniref:Uncharacterized protein n=1 Tax=Colletotrichum lupini TaxID=145971 RepID=A0A9Q8W8V6_9PEZI|nr:uncharacterized protein CLUP02_00994 [Colletotrichum lupini]UQC74346.1 hypothetical protein CLUP02_00994 [Colletotrichum lupini]
MKLISTVTPFPVAPVAWTDGRYAQALLTAQYEVPQPMINEVLAHCPSKLISYLPNRPCNEFVLRCLEIIIDCCQEPQKIRFVSRRRAFTPTLRGFLAFSIAGDLSPAEAFVNITSCCNIGIPGQSPTMLRDSTHQQAPTICREGTSTCDQTAYRRSMNSVSARYRTRALSASFYQAWQPSFPASRAARSTRGETRGPGGRRDAIPRQDGLLCWSRKVQRRGYGIIASHGRSVLTKLAKLVELDEATLVTYLWRLYFLCQGKDSKKSTITRPPLGTDSSTKPPSSSVVRKFQIHQANLPKNQIGQLFPVSVPLDVPYPPTFGSDHEAVAGAQTRCRYPMEHNGFCRIIMKPASSASPTPEFPPPIPGHDGSDAEILWGRILHTNRSLRILPPFFPGPESEHRDQQYWTAAISRLPVSRSGQEALRLCKAKSRPTSPAKTCEVPHSHRVRKRSFQQLRWMTHFQNAEFPRKMQGHPHPSNICGRKACVCTDAYSPSQGMDGTGGECSLPPLHTFDVIGLQNMTAEHESQNNAFCSRVIRPFNATQELSTLRLSLQVETIERTLSGYREGSPPPLHPNCPMIFRFIFDG